MDADRLLGDAERVGDLAVRASQGDLVEYGLPAFVLRASCVIDEQRIGQVLIVTEGVGRVQRWGGPVEEIRPGNVVRIPPSTKHWHGAAPTSAMTHIAIV